MKKEDIITLPNPKLRQRSVKVSDIDANMRQLADDMTSASLDWEDSRPHEISAALAAVQLGSLYRAIVVRSNFDDKEDRDFTALINPEIIKYEGEEVEDYEGCLSVTKGIYGMVKRASKIRVRALDIDGNEIRFKADGFLARVIQHEVDHLNGIVFVDRIRDNHEAFYHLEENGELASIDFNENIKNNRELWDDLK
jgi:peptide deformylase